MKRKKKRLPDRVLEAISDARDAAPQSAAYWGKWTGLMDMAMALGWDPSEIHRQVGEFDQRNPRDPALRPCCRTDPFGGHRGTCLESVMRSGREGVIVPPSML